MDKREEYELIKASLEEVKGMIEDCKIEDDKTADGTQRIFWHHENIGLSKAIVTINTFLKMKEKEVQETSYDEPER
jgi:hypothetical protein